MSTQSGDDLSTLLTRARAADNAAREQLISKYRPFVLSCVSKVAGRYVTLSDDEASVGLIGFNEAIDSYEPTRGSSFVLFAETVIRRRLIDHFRRQSRRVGETPFSSLKTETQDGLIQPVEDTQSRRSIDEYYIRQQEEERREEILRYSRQLNKYGIQFSELVRICPKHEDARLNAIAAARVVAGVPELAAHLKQRKELPITQMEERVSVSRKTLERQRKYIIAIAVILMEEYDHLREYVNK